MRLLSRVWRHVNNVKAATALIIMILRDGLGVEHQKENLIRFQALTPAPPSEVQARSKKPGAKATRFQQLLNLFMVGRAEGAEREEEEDSDYGFSCGNLFKCLCCPRPADDKSALKMAAILEKLDSLEKNMAASSREGGQGGGAGGSRLPSVTEETEDGDK